MNGYLTAQNRRGGTKKQTILEYPLEYRLNDEGCIGSCKIERCIVSEPFNMPNH